MRTKALIGAAILAAGAATSMAQSNVYSLNVVGYYNLTIPANQYVLLANQLNTTNNNLSSIIAAPSDGAIFQKFSGGFTAFVYDQLGGSWSGDTSMNPGEGGFFRDPNGLTLTFVGEVRQGSLTNTLPIGLYAVRSSIVPQQGLATTTLGIPAEDGDVLQTYSGGYTAYVYDGLGAVWTPSEPTLNVGQSFFYKKASTSTQNLWIRNFTVQ